MATTSRLPRAERRAQILEAAGAAFLEHGYDGTSMEDVARRAGVSRLIVYRIFESKPALYRAVLRTVIDDLRAVFAGLTIEQVRAAGAPTLMMPVARSNADAFRLLWRDAGHQPAFADVAVELRTYLTSYARALLRQLLDDDELLEWAARTISSHLVEGICNWLDTGDPARDAEVGVLMRTGIRNMAGAWLSPPE